MHLCANRWDEFVWQKGSPGRAARSAEVGAWRWAAGVGCAHARLWVPGADWWPQTSDPCTAQRPTMAQQRALPQSKETLLQSYNKRLKDDVKSIMDNFTEIIKTAKVGGGLQSPALSKTKGRRRV